MSETIYYLWANVDMVDKEISFEAYPDLQGKYIKYNNNLCPSRYDSKIMCFWEGDLSITLVLNDKEITINDHDAKNGRFSVVDNYIIQGLRTVINNRSREETFLEFKISK